MDKNFFIENIDNIKEICTTTAEVQIQNHEKKITYKSKSDNTPLTEIDLLSHDLITKNLKKICDNYPIISEEGYEKDVFHDEFWIIDPLDGTRNYIDKGKNFCINISFIKDRFPVFGAIYIPYRRELYYGIGGYGSYFQDQTGNTEKISCKNVSLDNLVLCSSSSMNPKKLDLIASNIKIVEHLKISSAIKFGILASGKGNFYPRFGPTYEWDTAAGQCILEESGGLIVDENFERLTYNKNSNYLNGKFFAFNGEASFWQPLISQLCDS